MPDPFIPPLREKGHLVNLLVGATGQMREEVVERLEREETSFGCLVREELDRRAVEPCVWSDKLGQFYQETNAFLYEALVWNLTFHKNRMRRWIAAFLVREFDCPVKILVYGDGPGFDSYYLAQAGHEVSFFEVARDAATFAESMFAAGDVDVRICRDAAKLPHGHFDALVCLDVLEHVPDPPALVEELALLLRPGGCMIVHAPFFFVSPVVSTHLRANRRYSGDLRRLFGPAGLRLIDGRLFWDPIVLQKVGDQGAAPTRPRWRQYPLRAAGLALAIGRYWSMPFSCVARGLIRRRHKHIAQED